MFANLHTVAMYGGILCLRCNGCGHRAALGNDKLNIRRRDMTPLYTLKFRCQSCGAKSNGTTTDTTFDRFIPLSRDDARAFVEGQNVPMQCDPMRG